MQSPMLYSSCGFMNIAEMPGGRKFLRPKKNSEPEDLALPCHKCGTQQGYDLRSVWGSNLWGFLACKYVLVEHFKKMTGLYVNQAFKVFEYKPMCKVKRWSSHFSTGQRQETSTGWEMANMKLWIFQRAHKHRLHFYFQVWLPPSLSTATHGGCPPRTALSIIPLKWKRNAELWGCDAESGTAHRTDLGRGRAETAKRKAPQPCSPVRYKK